MPDRDGALIALLATAAGVAMGVAARLAGASLLAAWALTVVVAFAIATLETRRP